MLPVSMLTIILPLLTNKYIPSISRKKKERKHASAQGVLLL